MWYLDSSCSRHMTRDKRKFKNFKRKEQGFVTYRDNNKGKILGIGDVGGGNTLEIKDVLFVEGLKHNLLNISPLCDKELKVIFESDYCTIHQKDSSVSRVITIPKRVLRRLSVAGVARKARSRSLCDLEKVSFILLL